jgi:hypothetical protein
MAHVHDRMKKHRELSLLKFVSHFQALADTWMKVIFKSSGCEFFELA